MGVFVDRWSRSVHHDTLRSREDGGEYVVFASLPPSYRRASFLDTHLHAYTMASIAKFSVAPKVAAARHGRFAGSRVSKVRPPTRDSGIARRGHVFG